MATAWIIEALDIVEHIRLGIIARSIDLSSRSLGLQGREEALHGGVVPHVPSPAHGACEAVTRRVQTAVQNAIRGRLENSGLTPSSHPTLLRGLMRADGWNVKRIGRQIKPGALTRDKMRGNMIDGWRCCQTNQNSLRKRPTPALIRPRKAGATQ